MTTLDTTHPEAVAALMQCDLSTREKQLSAAMDLEAAGVYPSLPVALDAVRVFADAADEPSAITGEIASYLRENRDVLDRLAKLEEARQAIFEKAHLLEQLREKVKTLEKRLARERNRLAAMEAYESNFSENYFASVVVDSFPDIPQKAIEQAKTRLAAREVARIAQNQVIPRLVAELAQAERELASINKPTPAPTKPAAAPAARTSRN